MVNSLNTPYQGRDIAMEASILLLADFASVDASGKLNVVGAFNIIYSENFPTVHPSMHLVIRLVATLGEFEQERKLKVILRDADGQEKWATPELPVKVISPKNGKLGRFDAIIAILGMEFENPGAYSFYVYLGKDFKGEIPVDLIQREMPRPGEE